MFKGKWVIWLITLCLLAISVPMVTAQSVCGILSEEIEDGDDVEAEITDEDSGMFYCFDAEEGDEVTIEIQVTDGDLILSASVANSETLEFLAFETANSSEDDIEFNIEIEEDGTYLILVTRQGSVDGDTEGEFELEFDLDEAESSSNNGDDDEEEDEPAEITFPDELEDYGGNWQDTIAELEDEGVIASGSGSLIFNEPFAFFDGEGAFFTPLARNSTFSDVIVGGELTFTSGSRREFESCSLLARIESTSQFVPVAVYLEVGIDNDGFAFWGDSSSGGFDSDFEDLDLDLDESHHVLFIAQQESLTVYINGELIFEQAEIDDRGGSFGIALIGRDANSRCEGSNIWAYQSPAFIPGVCEVTSSGTVNRRSGPGTTFETDGTLNAGEQIKVVGAEEGASGFTWYELEDGGWVREDVVTLIGDCANF